MADDAITWDGIGAPRSPFYFCDYNPAQFLTQKCSYVTFIVEKL